MKKVLVILGLVLLAAIIIISSNKIYTYYKSSQYQDTAVPYIKMVVPEISKWDPETIKGYMPPESLKNTPEEKIIKIVNYLSRLGVLKSMEEPIFSHVVPGETTIVTYKIDAEYEKGAAVITISLLSRGDLFQVYKFDINSMALAN